MTPIIPPPALPYRGPLQAIDAFWRFPPGEGDQLMPFSVQWAVDGGSGQCVEINPQQQQAGGGFSQIQAIYCNNVLCGVDVNFLALDTGSLLTVPAGTCGLFPFATRGNRLYAWAATGALGTDRTTFVLYNSLPPPVAITQGKLAAQPTFSSSIAIDGSTPTYQLVPATVVTGTIRSINMTVSAYRTGGASAVSTLTLADGAANNLCATFINGPTLNTDYQGYELLTLFDLNWRFSQGLVLNVAAAGPFASGLVTVVVSYRAP